MRIALLGTRGIPAAYGGFETFAEELSTRLVARGHTVRVYCRRHATEGLRSFRGVDLAYAPTLRHKYLDTIVHTFFSSLDLLSYRPDVALYCNGANAIFTLLPRVSGIPVALNVDGIERKRKKWNAAARGWYLASEWLATWCPNEVITDAEHIADYYRKQYGKETRFIPYGAATERTANTEVISGLGLNPDRYFLYVSRMEPENNALLVRQSFEKVATDRKLALIGDAPYARDYIAQVRDTQDARIVMPGGIYGEGYKQLGSHCFAYIHATEVGGTHPALIEAMGRGALTLFLDTPENREVAGGAGIPFTHETLTDRMREALAMPEEQRAMWRERARKRVIERYSWDAVTSMYENLLRDLCSQQKTKAA